MNGPVLLHVLYAERQRDMYRRSVIRRDSMGQSRLTLPPDFRSISGQRPTIRMCLRPLCGKWGRRQEKVVAITAAMPDGTGLKRFKNVFPERFLRCGDRGAACSDLCGRTGSGRHEAGGGGVFILLYSVLMIRSLHDVCIQNLHVIFAS